MAPTIIFSLFVALFVTRLIRAIPVYIRTGTLGDYQRCCFQYIFGVPRIKQAKDREMTLGEKVKDNVKAFFTETHPAAVLGDFSTVSASLLWFGVSPLVFSIFASIFIFIKVSLFLIRQARKNYLKKQEFHDTLKGEHTGTDNPSGPKFF